MGLWASTVDRLTRRITALNISRFHLAVFVFQCLSTLHKRTEEHVRNCFCCKHSVCFIYPNVCIRQYCHTVNLCDFTDNANYIERLYNKQPHQERQSRPQGQRFCWFGNIFSLVIQMKFRLYNLM